MRGVEGVKKEESRRDTESEEGKKKAGCRRRREGRENRKRKDEGRK
jgi:hypothetical protein